VKGHQIRESGGLEGAEASTNGRWKTGRSPLTPAMSTSQSESGLGGNFSSSEEGRRIREEGKKREKLSFGKERCCQKIATKGGEQERKGRDIGVKGLTTVRGGGKKKPLRYPDYRKYEEEIIENFPRKRMRHQ